MKKQIFRQEALDRMSSPEQLDELMPVTSPRGWLALAGIGMVLAVAVLWGMFGRIYTSAKATGVLVRQGGMIRVLTPQDGEVSAVSVDVGDVVRRGDSLVQLTVDTPDEGRTTRDIVCQQTGRVLYVAVIPGEPASEGDLLVGIELPQRPMQAVLYVSTKVGYQVQRGQSVQITPATAARYSSGPLLGVVQSAGRFPETRSSIFRVLQNPDWVDELLRRGPLLQIIVDLPQDKAIEEYYFGTPCTAEISVSRQRPIELVFPAFSNE